MLEFNAGGWWRDYCYVVKRLQRSRLPPGLAGETYVGRPRFASLACRFGQPRLDFGPPLSVR